MAASAAAGAAVFRELAKFPDLGLTHEYYDHSYHLLSERDEVPFGIVDIRDCTVLEIDDRVDLERVERKLRERGESA